MLEDIKGKLGGRVPEHWVSVEERRGAMIQLYREYDAGVHRDGLTTRQKNQLGISGREVLDQFNINYCPMIVDKMADRLKVEEIEVSAGADDANNAQVHIDLCREVSRFDELQNVVHRSAILDGYTFVMLDWDADLECTTWHHESAWDNDSKTGVIPILNEMGEMRIAIKVWNEMDTSGAAGKRVNVYYPAAIEMYVSSEDGELKPYRDDKQFPDGVVPWASKNGEPFGIPIHMFSNKKKVKHPLGQSELHNAIPLQDAANWELIDLIMTSRLTAFPMRTARGFEPPDNTAPGDWVEFGADIEDAALLAAMAAGVIPQGEMVPFLETITHIEDRLSVITRTPIPSSMGSSAQSGEALKERQSMLVEKVQSAQVTFGNVWEDIVRQALQLRDILGAGLNVTVTGLNTRWSPAQIRNDADLVAAAQIMHDWGYEKEALRLMGQLPYLGYDDAKIEMLLAEKSMQVQREIGLLNVPGFGSNASGGVDLLSA